ncbi:MAG TPA: hypothetical protein RMG48_19835 [Myxococcales bacterium LLY-WYZ-16_1]|jgi:2-oxo-4-hydroxy-4-carboxy--5-ureidoimidazoline (OHCU) decarboxylase|nr:hypothetical protein [Myxococcales bacterium LLY-WYZ-16_1]
MVNGIDNKPIRPDLDGRIQGQYQGQNPLDVRQQNTDALRAALDAVRNPQSNPTGAGAQRFDNPVQRLEDQLAQFMDMADKDPTQLLELLNDNPDLADALRQSMPAASQAPQPGSFVTS